MPLKLEPWPGCEVRQASVNSFGYGGTNALIILESASTDFLAAETCKYPSTVKIEDVKYAESLNPGLLELHDSTTTTRFRAKVNKDKERCSRQEAVINSPATLVNSATGRREVRGDHFSVSVVPQIFVMSARSEKSLREVVKKLKDWVSKRYDYQCYFEDLAYNLSSRRSLMQWRYSVVANSYEELTIALDQSIQHTNRISSTLRVGYVFTGQGAQWFAMGRELIFTHSRFAKSLFKSNEILHELGASWSLIEELLCDEVNSRINQSEIAQPAITALQVALVDLLDDIGIKPQVVLGHSSGEIAAAYTAGILPHATALKVSYCRSFVSSYCKRTISRSGAMIAVGLDEDQIRPLIAEIRSGVVSVACVNSPFSSTVSGDEDAILELEQMLNQLSIFNRKLNVDTAYHSHHMQKIAHEYLCSLGELDTRAVRDDVKFISTVIAAEKTLDFGPAYWVENLVSKVRFSDALHFLLAHPKLMRTQSTQALIEIGPHSVLAGPIRQTITQSLKS